jgi:hypothetical protein
MRNLKLLLIALALGTTVASCYVDTGRPYYHHHYYNR